MKTALLLAVVIVTLSSLPFLSRRIDAAAQENDNASASRQARATTIQPVHAELVSGVDDPPANSGDTITVEIRDQFTAADGIVIPAGSRLVGHLTDMLHGETEQTASNLRLAQHLVLDRAELSSGQMIPLHSAFASVAPLSSLSAMSAGTPAATHTFHLDPGSQIVLGVSANRSPY
jgi:hypothetical protein